MIIAWTYVTVRRSHHRSSCPKKERGILNSLLKLSSMLRALALYIGEHRTQCAHKVTQQRRRTRSVRTIERLQRFSRKWMLFLRTKEEKQKFGFFIVSAFGSNRICSVSRFAIVCSDFCSGCDARSPLISVLPEFLRVCFLSRSLCSLHANRKRAVN